MPVIRCMCWRPEKWLMKMVAALYLCVVSLSLSCATKPGCMEMSWSTEATCPGLVAMKTYLPDSWPFVYQGTLVIAPKRHHMHHSGIVFASFFGNSPYFANCFNLSNHRWPRWQCQGMSLAWLVSAVVLSSRRSESKSFGAGEKVSGQMRSSCSCWFWCCSNGLISSTCLFLLFCCPLELPHLSCSLFQVDWNLLEQWILLDPGQHCSAVDED